MKTTHFMTHLLVAFFLLVTSCSLSEKNIIVKNDTLTTTQPNKVLIVYLSRTNNTKAIAEIIQSNMGGKLVALELENPYPENYQAIVAQVAKENETGLIMYLPSCLTSMPTSVWIK